MSDTVVLIDANNLLYRGHFSHKGLATKNGVPTSCIYSFLNLTKDLYKRYPHADLVFCWDAHGRHVGGSVSKRKQLFPAYKGNRKPNKDTEIAQAQVPAVKEMLSILGHLQAEVAGVEADDLISLAAKHLRHIAEKIVIYSGDKDLYQCVVPGKTVIFCQTAKGPKELDVAAVRKSCGTSEKGIPLLKALMGDSSDNYPGVYKCGPKKALVYLSNGINPSVKEFAELSDEARKFCPELEPVWKDIHTYYRLAKLPISVDGDLIPEESKAFINSFLFRLLNYRERVYTRDTYAHAIRKFNELCLRYELAAFMVQKQKFFGTAKITQ